MYKVMRFCGDIYYKYFTEQERGVNYETTTFVDRLWFSLIGLAMLRLLVGSIFYYFIEQGYTPIEPYGLANFLWALLGGYLLAPIVEVFLIKGKEPKKKFLKGAWIPLPMTLIWLLIK